MIPKSGLMIVKSMNRIANSIKMDFAKNVIVDTKGEMKAVLLRVLKKIQIV